MTALRFVPHQDAANVAAAGRGATGAGVVSATLGRAGERGASPQRLVLRNNAN